MSYPGQYLGPAWTSPRGPVASSASGYVRGAADVCVTDRCHLTEGLSRLQEAGQLIERLRAEKTTMEQTAALWCDAGHAFSARDRGRKRITVTVQDEETGDDVKEDRQFCGQCEVTTALVSKPLLGPPKHEVQGRYSAARVAELERELGILRDGE